MSDLERIRDNKVNEIEKWGIQVVLYDSRGNRLYTDYFTSNVHPEFAIKVAVSTYESKKPGRKPAIAIVIRRRYIASKILE